MKVNVKSIDEIDQETPASSRDWSRGRKGRLFAI